MMAGMRTTDDVLEDLEAALDALAAADPAELADATTVVTLHRLLERLDAVTTRAAVAFDASRGWEADEARTAVAWLSTRCRRPEATCRRRLQRGRQLQSAAATEAAWAHGDISAAHVDVLTAAGSPVTAEAFERDERMLLDLACQLPFRDFQRAVAYWRQLADPDGVEVDAAAARAGRRLHLSQSLDGTWFLDGHLDSIDGAIVAGAIRRIEQELFEADWAQARGDNDGHPTASDLARTPAQRRADALVELARRAGAVPAGGRLPEPLFTVLVDYETLAGRVCELADRTAVTPGQLAPWLTEGWVERVVFDGPDRVKSVGHRRRVFTGATRRAVEVRDRECFHEFCHEPADDGEIDHIQPYAAGGPTVDANGRAACAFHHRQRHRRR